MNKYQGALDRLFMWATNGYCALEVPSAEYEDLKEIMQELVDKATPKKAIIDSVQDVRYTIKYICPNCGSKFIGTVSKHCYHCGQALKYEERSEDEETHC